VGSPNFDIRELEYRYQRAGQGQSTSKEFDSIQQEFICAGIYLATPVDKVPKSKYPILRNVRGYQAGRIESRPGQTAFTNAAAAGGIHSIKRLNDDKNGLFTRLCGAGAKLYSGNAVLAEIDAGYSGDPLSFVTWRPSQSPEPWVYIGDRTRMRKARRDGTNFPIGIAPPNIAPSAIFAAPNYNIADDLDSAAGWAQGGTAGAPAVENRVNTLIDQILYDTGAAGWASIAPVDMTNIDLSAILKFDAGAGTEERAIVFGVFRAIPSTILGSITYDAGALGLCTMQPTALTAPAQKRAPVRRVLDDDLLDPYDPVIKRSLSKRLAVVDRGPTLPNTSWLTALGVVPDAMIKLAAGTPNEETVRIISVAVGKDGIASVRCSTTKTHVAGETIDGLRSFRTYLANAHISGGTVTDINVKSTIATGTGYLSKVTPFNLGLIGARPTQDSDEIHVSIRIDNLANLIEGRIIFDVDAGLGFANNYLFHAFRPNDLIPGIKLSTTMLNAQQRALQNRYVDQTQQQFSQRMRSTKYSDDYTDFDLSSRYARRGATQSTTGDAQWFDLHFKVSDMTRVGSDKARGLNDVTGIRLQFTVAGQTVVGVDSLWVGGSYGPDIGEVGDPYLWRYRYRSKQTGAKSNPSPPMRFGLSPHRQRIQLNATASPDAQVDAIDWYRWGGVLPEWLYVGTGDNGAGNFFDEMPDQDLVFSELLDFDNFQPFPSVDTPKSGTCDVVGTAITKKTGDAFSTSWAPGTIININGTDQILYASPTAADRLEIVDNAGSLAGAKFFINEPVVLAQPSPVLFGPFKGFMFGLDPNRPGTLVFTKGNDPDSAPETGYIEITDASNPLLNGGVFDTRVILASSKGFHAVIPAFDDVNVFDYIDLPVDDGPMSRWAFCVKDGRGYYVGKDGVYVTAGGPKQSITGDLYPLFPHDGQPGVATNGYLPIDMTRASDMRLTPVDSQIYFDYVDTAGTRCTLIFDIQVNGWFFDQYATPVIVHYADEGKNVHATFMGGTDGKLHQLIGATDNGAAIHCQVRTYADDRGDRRANKLWGDCLLDVDTNKNPAVINVVPYLDNFDFSLPGTAIDGSAEVGRNHYVIDLQSGAGKLARNFALDIQWDDTVGVKLYQYEATSRTKNEDTVRRYTDWNDLGYQGAKFIQGIIIEADTGNIPRTLQILMDEGAVGATIQVQHNGQVHKPYSFAPFVAHAIRLAPQDGESWRLDQYRAIWEPAPELAAAWITQGTTHDLKDFQHVRAAYIALESSAVVTLKITIDGADYSYDIPSTVGTYKKVYVPLKAIKGKLFTYSLTSANPFRLYARDCEVRVRSFDQQGPYAVANPFGDIHRIYGARI
jgi:hypothetical protein